MKKRILFSLLMVTILIVTLALVGCNKTTGGGSFYSEEWDGEEYIGSDFYTFGFNVQPVGEPSEEPIATFYISNLELNIYQQDAKGQMTLVNHTEGYKVKVTFDNTIDFTDEIPIEIPYSLFVGPAMVKTQGMENDVYGPYSVLGMFMDSGDESIPDQVQVIIGEGDALAFITALLEDPENFDPETFTDFTILLEAGGPLEPGSDIVIH